MRTATKAFRGTACALVAIAIVLGSLRATVQSEQQQWANEYELKAAFVYRLMAFVEWPGVNEGERLIVGFAGEGPTGAALLRFLQGKHVGPRVIDVREVRSTADLRACNVLVVDYPDLSRARQAVTGTRDAGVLTIGDGEAFVRMGGMIALVPHENTFQVAVNPEAAERAHIKISSKLLSIARRLSAEETP